MDFDILASMIGSVGFPIVACCIMFKQNSKLQETLTNISLTMRDLTNEIQDIERRIENNDKRRTNHKTSTDNN